MAAQCDNEYMNGYVEDYELGIQSSCKRTEEHV